MATILDGKKVAGKVKEITENDPVLKTARDLGICFGD